MPLKKISDAFHTYIFDSYHISARNLGLYRICYAGFFLLFGIPNFSWIAQNPNAFFFPPTLSLAALFPGFPSYWFLQLLSLVICVLFIFLLFGYHTRKVSLALPLLVIIGKSFAFSFGKIDHGLLIWLVPWVMTLAGWGKELSIDARRNSGHTKSYSWPIAMLGLLLGFAFFTAGFKKLMGGWLDPGSSAVHFYVLQSIKVFDREALLGAFSLSVTPGFIWELLDYLTVIFEVGFLFAVIRQRIFRKFVFAALIFHFGVFLTMRITTSWMYIVYLAFANWEVIEDQLSRYEVYKKAQNVMQVKWMVTCLGLYLTLYLFGQTYLVMPAVPSVSPLSIISQTLSIDYHDIFGSISILVGLTIGLYIAFYAYSGRTPLSSQN